MTAKQGLVMLGVAMVAAALGALYEVRTRATLEGAELEQYYCEQIRDLPALIEPSLRDAERNAEAAASDTIEEGTSPELACERAALSLVHVRGSIGAVELLGNAVARSRPTGDSIRDRVLMRGSVSDPLRDLEICLPTPVDRRAWRERMTSATASTREKIRHGVEACK